MPSHQSGFLTGSFGLSGPPALSLKRKSRPRHPWCLSVAQICPTETTASAPAPASTDEVKENPLTTAFVRLQLSPRQPPCVPRSAATRSGVMPSWGQLKALAEGAHSLVAAAHLLPSAPNLFVAMLSLLAAEIWCLSLFPVVAADMSYWAYLPDPPMFHPASWDFGPIKVTTNNTDLLGGESNSYLTQKTEYNFSYMGMSDTLPVCFSINKDMSGCVPLAEHQLIADSPTPPTSTQGDDGQEQRDVWFLKLYLPKKYNTSAYEIEPTALPKKLPVCQNSTDLDSIWEKIPPSGYPKWFSCGFPTKTIKYSLFNSSLSLLDWSVSSPDHDYTQTLKQAKYIRGDNTMPTVKASAWYGPGWVAPSFRPQMLGKKDFPVQLDLFRLFAATRKVTIIRPRGTVIQTSAPVTACVAAPFSIIHPGMEGHFYLQQSSHGIFHVSCSNCILSNCITETSEDVFLILRQPPYVMLPVNITGNWFSNPGIEALHRAMVLITRPKRFVATLILGITALIGIISSFSLSTTSLVKEIHTANHVNQLSKNVSLALMIQENIDRGIQDRLNALEEAVLFIGNEIQNIKIRLSVQCHSLYRWICVTPLPYNDSEHDWSQVKSHLQGLWNNSQLTMDMGLLHEKISDISNSHVGSASLEEVSTVFASAVTEFVSNTSWRNFLFNICIIAGLVLVLLFLLPVIFRQLCYSLSALTVDVQAIQLKQKGEDAEDGKHNTSGS
uniref:endogenous retrovirus group K member 25 Env polyprotein-like n=1 Tax=Jaculus jaculus TaxID=51337 RepID=UPI001E1B00CE|nr:endogenous retrovirus group K member 25 Env polyprotein-like [Jaculus jaculus]